jgi:hypothetical protein
MVDAWSGQTRRLDHGEAMKIYQNSDVYIATQQDRYMSYMFCVLIMKDNSRSTAPFSTGILT